MENIFTTYKNKLKTVKTAWEYPLDIAKNIIRFYKDGYVETETIFELEGNAQSFRTIIQPDADILDFIPDFSKIKLTSKIEKVIYKARKDHIKKVRALTAKLSDSEKLIDAALNAVLITLNLFPFIYSVIELPWEQWWYNVVLAVTTFLSKKFAGKSLIKYFGKIVFGIIRKFLPL